MKLVRKIEIGTGDVHGIDFSESGEILFVGGSNSLLTYPIQKNSIKYLSNHEERPLEKYFGHNGKVLCVKRAGRYLYTTSDDASCIRWLLLFNEARPQFSQRYASHQGPIMGLDISKNESVLVTSSQDGTVILWGNESQWGDVVRKWDIEHRLQDIFFACDGQKLVVGGWDEAIHVLNVASHESHRKRLPLTDVVTGIGISNKHNVVVGASEDRNLRAYDIISEKILWESQFPNYVWRMVGIDDNNLLVAGCGHFIFGVDFLSGRIIFENRMLDSGHFLNWIAIHHERKMLALSAIEEFPNGDYRGQKNIYVFGY